MGAIIDRTYKGCGHNHDTKWDKLKSAWFNITKLGVHIKDTEGIYTEVDGLDPGTISKKLFLHSRKELISNINSTFPNAKYGDKVYNTVNKLIKNIDNFSAYKSQYFTKLLQNATDDERSDIMAMYSRQLKVESAMASRSIEAVAKWKEHISTQELYPNLEYMKSRSPEKRSEHTKLVGIIRSINDPWWKSNYPPNGWNCKCWVRSTDSPITAGSPEDLKPVNGLVGNAGQSETVFNNDHPFINNEYNNSEKTKGHSKVKHNLDSFKQNVPYNKTPDYVAKNGSKLYVNTYYHKKDGETNYKKIKLLVDQIPNTKAKIRPHSEGETGIGEYGKSNPEYEINEHLADLKEPKGYNIQNTYKSAIKQHCEIILFSINKDVNIEDVKNSIKGAVNYRIRNNKKNPIKQFFIEQNEIVIEYKPQKS